MSADRTTISIAPDGANELFATAIEAGGGTVVPLGPDSRGLVWVGHHDPDGLRAAIAAAPALDWVQLPSAGIEDFVREGLLDPSVTWTSAKGAYAKPVAEHALTLALAVLRHIPERARASSWGRQKGTSLHGLSVVVLGAGGIAQELLALLAPFGVTTTVVRRSAEPLAGADRTVTTAELDAELVGADIVFLAAALTDGTSDLIGERQLAILKPGAVIVNVARGGLIDTAALVAALESGHLGGAGLDVTAPEPLPDGHPLWSAPHVLITPHSADTPEMIRPLLAERVTTNTRRFIAGDALVGRVDPGLGY
jgi:phosphoglycerate dehydrogenase-like enzyme